MEELLKLGWYAVYVRSRHEKSVEAQLKAKPHETFLPLYSQSNRWADRWKTVYLPLFPGYVFCRFDQTTRTSVLTTSGVIDVVRIGARFAPIPNSEIARIRLVVETNVQAEPYPDLPTGQHVTLSGGPLKGLTGSLLEGRKGPRIVVSVELLQRSVAVEIDRVWVTLADVGYLTPRSAAAGQVRPNRLG